MTTGRGLGPAQITVVGGGVAGLVAAIVAAEGGARVVLHEATDRLGGRALTSPPPFVANFGPHALYADGPWWPWLTERGLLPPVGSLPSGGFRFRAGGRLRRLPPAHLALAATRLRAEAPSDVDFRTWATDKAGPAAASAAIGMLSLATYDADPGRLAAAFAQERFQRALKGAVRYPVGGWPTLVGMLQTRARSLGVDLRLKSRISELPDVPVVVATKLSAARTLLHDPALRWEGSRVALLDLGLKAGRRWPSGVLDLDEHVYAARYTEQDPTLAPPGHDLVQASAGMRAGESIDQAVTRIERVVDAGYAGWRARETWRRQMVGDHATGALDLPGSTWRDRPAVDRGNGVFLAGDMTACPGLLSEVSLNSAVAAARGALACAGDS